MIRLESNNKSCNSHFVDVRRIETRIRNVLRLGYVTSRGSRINLSNSVRGYLNYLLLGNNLEQLIVCDASNLNGIIGYINANHPNILISGSDDNAVVKNVFVNHGYEKMDKHKFINYLGLDTCPYCNRSYIYTLSRSSRIKPEIDHFYPKSRYPFLAISYYNLIPSCQTCNGIGGKHDKDPIPEGLVNPYLLSSSDFKFSYKIKSINFLNPRIDKKSVDVLFKKNIAGHLNVFKLQELYQEHSDHIIELIIKSKISYSDIYRKYLGSYKGLNLSDKEIDRLIIGNYTTEEELHKRPLAKMYRDIGKELGLI